MKIGVLGTGDVGRVLAKAFITLGHEVKMGARAANNDKAVAWAKESGPKASQGTFGDAAKFGEIVVLATLGEANEAAIGQAGPENFKGKIVIDATNPLDHSKGMPPSLIWGGGGELVQRLLPGAKVVKAFNTVGNPFMFKPQFAGGPPDMFICGDDAQAKQKVTEILRDFGWGAVDIGGISSARYTEAMCLAWVMRGVTSGSWNHAFKLLTK